MFAMAAVSAALGIGGVGIAQAKHGADDPPGHAHQHHHHHGHHHGYHHHGGKHG